MSISASYSNYAEKIQTSETLLVEDLFYWFFERLSIQLYV